MILTPLEQGLGSALLAIIAGLIGHYAGGRKAVKENTCCERRDSCFTLLMEKIEGLEKTMKNMAEIINHKLLGL